MTRLPTPGADENVWGAVLNDFLTQSHKSDGTLKASAAVLLTDNQTIAGIKTFVSSPDVPDGSFPQSKVVGLAAALADKADAVDVSGYELAVAQKSDAVFTTTSTVPVLVSSLSIVVTVPDRPYVVRVSAVGTMEEVAAFGRLEITLAGGTSIGATPAIVYAGTAGGQASFFSEIRIPNAFHAPAANSTVTYEVRARTGSATSDFSVLAGNVAGTNFVATLAAITQ